MVASCRVATAISVSLTRLVKPGMVISCFMFTPVFGVTANGHVAHLAQLPHHEGEAVALELTLHEIARCGRGPCSRMSVP